MREQYGTVRVSTAYGFYEAVVKHLTFHQQAYDKKAKQPFEATSYETYYVAANENDEIGKQGMYIYYIESFICVIFYYFNMIYYHFYFIIIYSRCIFHVGQKKNVELQYVERIKE